MNIYTNRAARVWLQAKAPTLSVGNASSVPVTIATGSAAHLGLLARVPSLSARTPLSVAVELPRSRTDAQLPTATLRVKMDRKQV